MNHCKTTVSTQDNLVCRVTQWKEQGTDLTLKLVLILPPSIQKRSVSGSSC